jgi:hypothetical protein
MPMAMNELWSAMDHDAAAGKSDVAGWLLRLARPDVGCPLFAAIEIASRRRAVLLRLPVASVPARRQWPSCKGLDPVALKLGGNEHFGVALKDERFRDVFSSLAEDLVRRVSEAATPAQQSSAFLGQLARWQKFLTTSPEGLSDKDQRGLWGELYFLRQHLLPQLGPSAVVGWKGSEHAHQDFQFIGGAVEIKTTVSKQPQVVRISSERQLDRHFWPTLILHVIALDICDGTGETLPELIASIRTALKIDIACRETFEDGLLQAGYLDVHAARYADRGYAVRSNTSLHVTDAFPALTEQMLPPGVGDITYGLAIASCEGFRISSSELKDRLSVINSAPQP